MALFSGQKQDVLKMALGVAIYVCYFLGYAHLNKWLYIPLDIIVVGGGELSSSRLGVRWIVSVGACTTFRSATACPCCVESWGRTYAGNCARQRGGFGGLR